MNKENIQWNIRRNNLKKKKNVCDVKNVNGVNTFDELIRGKAIDWRSLKLKSESASELSKIDDHSKSNCKILLKLTYIENTHDSY